MRVANRLLAFLVGLALAFGFGLAVAEMAAGLSGSQPLLVPLDQWDGVLSQLQWDNVGLVGAAAGLIVVGLLLLVFELFPRRPLQLPLQARSEGRAASIERRGLQERLRGVAIADPDVLAARVRVRRKAKVRAQVPPDADRREARSRLGGSLRAAVDELELQKPLRVKLDVVAGRERVR